MEYLEITVAVPEESKEAVRYRMGAMGAMGFAEEGSKVIAYFEQTSSPAEICRELAGFKAVLASSGLDPSLSCSFRVLPDRDWNETWKKNFRPIDVGDSLTIIPSWLPMETERIPIIIDPGIPAWYSAPAIMKRHKPASSSSNGWQNVLSGKVYST
jgi:ribosomal protein L11 methyltransferase